MVIDQQQLGAYPAVLEIKAASASSQASPVPTQGPPVLESVAAAPAAGFKSQADTTTNNP